jgi:hypothetical protein
MLQWWLGTSFLVESGQLRRFRRVKSPLIPTTATEPKKVLTAWAWNANEGSSLKIPKTAHDSFFLIEFSIFSRIHNSVAKSFSLHTHAHVHTHTHTHTHTFHSTHITPCFPPLSVLSRYQDNVPTIAKAKG